MSLTKQVSVIALLSVGLLSGCTSKHLAAVTESMLNQQDPGIQVLPPPASEAATPVSTFDKILGSMTSVTATPASAATLALFNLDRASFPLVGKSSEISSGMWMSISALAGSVCNDLYTKEKALPAAQRLYYADINFTATGTNNLGAMINGSPIKNRLYRRFALGFWGRVPNASPVAEDTIFDDALTEAGLTSTALNQNDTKDALLILCSGALASLSAISI